MDDNEDSQHIQLWVEISCLYRGCKKDYTGFYLENFKRGSKDKHDSVLGEW